MASKVGQSRQTAGAFDIRLIIAALFLIYGVVLTVMGLVAVGPDELAKSADFNINLWTGIGMLIFALAFGLWTKLRPLVVTEPSSDEESVGH